MHKAVGKSGGQSPVNTAGNFFAPDSPAATCVGLRYLGLGHRVKVVPEPVHQVDGAGHGRPVDHLTRGTLEHEAR